MKVIVFPDIHAGGPGRDFELELYRRALERVRDAEVIVLGGDIFEERKLINSKKGKVTSCP